MRLGEAAFNWELINIREHFTLRSTRIFPVRGLVMGRGGAPQKLRQKSLDLCRARGSSPEGWRRKQSAWFATFVGVTRTRFRIKAGQHAQARKGRLPRRPTRRGSFIPAVFIS